MDNKELLLQIAEMMEQQAIKMDQQTVKIELMIENKVTKRLDALLDGYKTTHEKQWELERKTEAMQGQIDDLTARLTTLENRTA